MVTPDEGVTLVDKTPQAAALLKPLRLRILAAARQPASATTIAARLGLSRQVVNYHVRQLARRGFLRRAGRTRKRGLIEQRYIVSANAFVLAPDVLGPLNPGPQPAADKFSAAYLLAQLGVVQREIAQVWRDAQAQGKRVPVLALDSELRFESAAQRASFADALTRAITTVIAEHSSPTDGEKRSGRRYRLTLGCYPIPAAAP